MHKKKGCATLRGEEVPLSRGKGIPPRQGSRSWVGLIGVVLSLLVFIGVSSAGTTNDRLSVFVTIPPQAYLVNKICGAHCDTHILVGEGVSPHTYEPTPRQVALLSSAHVFFTIGLPLEQAIMAKVKNANKSLFIVPTHKGIAMRPIAHAGHDTSIPDPHIWLDPQRAIIIAQNICAGLTEVAPQWASCFATNLQRLTAELSLLDQRIRDILLPVRGKKVYVLHPAFGYFTDAFGLIQVPIEEEGKEPSPRHLAHLLSRAKQERVKAIFVQPQFSPKGAEVIAREVKAEVVPLDPLAYDYVTNLETMARLIRDKL